MKAFMTKLDWSIFDRFVLISGDIFISICFITRFENMWIQPVIEALKNGKKYKKDSILCPFSQLSQKV